MIVFSQIVPKEFLEEFLPNVIINKIIAEADPLRFENMDRYLASIDVKYSTLDILKYAVQNWEIKKVNQVYIIEISHILRVDGYSVKQLVDIIDYGTTEVKGTGVYKEIENFINNNRAILVNRYSPGN